MGETWSLGNPAKNVDGSSGFPASMKLSQVNRVEAASPRSLISMMWPAGLVVVGVGFPVDGQRVEAHGELLAGFAGMGIDHDVAGVGVDAGQAGHFDGDA